MEDGRKRNLYCLCLDAAGGIARLAEVALPLQLERVEEIAQLDFGGFRRVGAVNAVALDVLCEALADGPFGGATLRISGTMAVAMMKQAAMARKASA